MKLGDKEVKVYADLLRRYVCFHDGEDMEKINCFGLALWGIANKMAQRGKIKPLDWDKENKHGWIKPTKQGIEEILIPAYEKYKSDTSRHPENKYDFGSYDSYIYLVRN